jgi:hypothetical protein
MLPEVQVREDPYKKYLLDLWTATSQNMISFRVAYLRNEIDKDSLVEFTALLTELWAQLRPKARGTDVISDELFKKYDEYFRDPGKIFDNPEDLFEMYQDIRELLEKIGITKFEEVG